MACNSGRDADSDCSFAFVYRSEGAEVTRLAGRTLPHAAQRHTRYLPPAHLWRVDSRIAQWVPPYLPIYRPKDMPLGEALDDDYVAEILKRDAQASSARNFAPGYEGLLTARR